MPIYKSNVNENGILLWIGFEIVFDQIEFYLNKIKAVYFFFHRKLTSIIEIYDNICVYNMLFFVGDIIVSLRHDLPTILYIYIYTNW